MSGNYEHSSAGPWRWAGAKTYWYHVRVIITWTILIENELPRFHLIETKNIHMHYKIVRHFELLRSLISASKDANSGEETTGMLSSCQNGCKLLISTSL